MILALVISSLLTSQQLGDFYTLGSWVPRSVGSTDTAGSDDAYVERYTNTYETTHWKCYFREDVAYGEVRFPDGTFLPSGTAYGEWHKSDEMPQPQWLEDWYGQEEDPPFWLVGIGYFDTDPPDSEFKKYLPADVRTNAWRNAQWGTPVNPFQKKPHDANELGTKDVDDDWENAISYNCFFDYDVWWKFEDYPAIQYQRDAMVIFYMYYEQDEITTNRVLAGWTPNIHRLTPDVMAGIESTFEGWCERMYIASQGQTNGWVDAGYDEPGWGPTTRREFDFRKFTADKDAPFVDGRSQFCRGGFAWTTNRVFRTRRLVEYEWLRDVSRWFERFWHPYHEPSHILADDPNPWDSDRTFVYRPSWILGIPGGFRYYFQFDPYRYALSWSSASDWPIIGIRASDDYPNEVEWTRDIMSSVPVSEWQKAWPTFRAMSSTYTFDSVADEFISRLNICSDVDFAIERDEACVGEDGLWHYFYFEHPVTNSYIAAMMTNAFPKLDISTYTNQPPTRRLVFDHFAACNAALGLMDRTIAFPELTFPVQATNFIHESVVGCNAEYSYEVDFTNPFHPKVITCPTPDLSGVTFGLPEIGYSMTGGVSVASQPDRETLRFSGTGTGYHSIAGPTDRSTSNSAGLIYLEEDDIIPEAFVGVTNCYIVISAGSTTWTFPPWSSYGYSYDMVSIPVGSSTNSMEEAEMTRSRIYHTWTRPEVVTFRFEDEIDVHRNYIVSKSYPLDLKIGPTQPGAEGASRVGYSRATCGLSAVANDTQYPSYYPVPNPDPVYCLEYMIGKGNFSGRYGIVSRINEWRETLNEKMVEFADGIVGHDIDDTEGNIPVRAAMLAPLMASWNPDVSTNSVLGYVNLKIDASGTYYITGRIEHDATTGKPRFSADTVVEFVDERGTRYESVGFSHLYIGEVKLEVKNLKSHEYEIPGIVERSPASVDGKLVPVTTVDWDWHALRRRN